MSKRIALLFLTVVFFLHGNLAQVTDVPKVRLFDKAYYKYEVKPKETIYSLCRRFQVTEAELTDANPSLSNGLKSGQTLLIPVKEAQGEINGLQSTEERKSTPSEDKPLFVSTDKPRITLILPFAATDAPGMNERYVEFYKGFLLAVDSLKTLGLTFEVQALESGYDTETVNTLVRTGKLDQTDYCIGGVTPAQIGLLADWAAKNQRPLILPFSSHIPELDANPYLIQTVTPYSYVFGRLAEYAAQRAGSSNIIFLRSSVVDNSDIRSELIPKVIARFKQLGIPYHEVDDDEKLENLTNVLSESRLNQIMPTPLNQQETNNLLTRLGGLHHAMPQYRMTVVGYPDWMAIGKTYRNLLFDLNTVIYSNFYPDAQQRNVRDFQILYNRTYDQNLLNMYPKFGMMGYDVAAYFITRMVFEKSEVEEQPPIILPLQNEYKFSPVRPGCGQANQCFYIINYKPDNEVDVKAMN